MNSSDDDRREQNNFYLSRRSPARSVSEWKLRQSGELRYFKDSLNKRGDPRERHLCNTRSPARSVSGWKLRESAGGGEQRELKDNRGDPRERYLGRTRSPARSVSGWKRRQSGERRDFKDSLNKRGDPRERDLCSTRSPARSVSGMDNLIRDFQTLLVTEQEADITIRVKSEVFHAHRIILVARSTVFAAMFRHDMKEKKTGLIDIEDCEPSAFQDFLTFIYTGKIENLSFENVFGISFLANKYDLSDLLQICIDFMEENLCLDTVCNVLSAADKFNLIDLKVSAKELFLKNKINVMKTKNWISFIRENPELLTEILTDAFSEVNYDRRRR